MPDSSQPTADQTECRRHLRLIDLFEALNDAILEQPEAVQNTIADAYTRHKLYLRHLPEAAQPKQEEAAQWN